MSQLESSWNLIETIKQMDIKKELNCEIEKYIENYKKTSKLKTGSFLNISFRSNLHYIIDHINDENLINALKILNLE